MFGMLRRNDMLWVIKLLLLIAMGIFGIGTYNYYTRVKWLIQNQAIFNKPFLYVYMSFGGFLTITVLAILLMIIFNDKPKSK